jgi:hypothetical protein
MRNVSGGGARQEITDKSVVEQAPCPARCHGIRLLTGDSENIRSASPVRIAASVGPTRSGGEVCRRIGSILEHILEPGSASTALTMMEIAAISSPARSSRRAQR